MICKSLTSLTYVLETRKCFNRSVHQMSKAVLPILYSILQTCSSLGPPLKFQDKKCKKGFFGPFDHRDGGSTRPRGEIGKRVLIYIDGKSLALLNIRSHRTRRRNYSERPSSLSDTKHESTERRLTRRRWMRRIEHEAKKASRRERE